MRCSRHKHRLVEGSCHECGADLCAECVRKGSSKGKSFCGLFCRLKDLSSQVAKKVWSRKKKDSLEVPPTPPRDLESGSTFKKKFIRGLGDVVPTWGSSGEIKKNRLPLMKLLRSTLLTLSIIIFGVLIFISYYGYKTLKITLRVAYFLIKTFLKFLTSFPFVFASEVKKLFTGLWVLAWSSTKLTFNVLGFFLKFFTTLAIGLINSSRLFLLWVISFTAYYVPLTIKAVLSVIKSSLDFIDAELGKVYVGLWKLFTSTVKLFLSYFSLLSLSLLNLSLWVLTAFKLLILWFAKSSMFYLPRAIRASLRFSRFLAKTAYIKLGKLYHLLRSLLSRGQKSFIKFALRTLQALKSFALKSAVLTRSLTLALAKAFVAGAKETSVFIARQARFTLQQLRRLLGALGTALFIVFKITHLVLRYFLYSLGTLLSVALNFLIIILGRLTLASYISTSFVLRSLRITSRESTEVLRSVSEKLPLIPPRLAIAVSLIFIFSTTAYLKKDRIVEIVSTPTQKITTITPVEDNETYAEVPLTSPATTSDETLELASKMAIPESALPTDTPLEDYEDYYDEYEEEANTEEIVTKEPLIKEPLQIEEKPRIQVAKIYIPEVSKKPTPPKKIPKILPPILKEYSPPDITRVSTKRRLVVLTFDGGWSASDASWILDILADRKVRATMFITGKFIEKYPSIVRRMVRDGHEVANHTTNHPHLTSFGANKRQTTLPGVTKKFLASELSSTARSFKRITGKRIKPYWRAPYGEVNPELRAWAFSEGYIHIGWTSDLKKKQSLDSLDWVEDKSSKLYLTSSEIRDRILDFGHGEKEGLNGGIILMHLGTNRKTDKASKRLGEIIDLLRYRGYNFTTVTGLIKRNKETRAIIVKLRKSRGDKIAMKKKQKAKTVKR